MVVCPQQYMLRVSLDEEDAPLALARRTKYICIYIYYYCVYELDVVLDDEYVSGSPWVREAEPGIY